MKIILMMMLYALITACSTIKNMSLNEQVKPWQKDVLAQPAMQFPQDTMFSFSDNHIFFSKEASTGGTGVGGGGCGCN